MTNDDKYNIIINEVCRQYNVERKDLLTPSHARIYSEPRYVIFYFARKMTDLTQEVIAGKFNRDHASASHGVNLIKNLIKINGTAKDTTKIEGRIRFMLKLSMSKELVKRENEIRRARRRQHHFRAMFRKSRMVKRLILAG